MVAEGVQISRDWNIPDITETDVQISKLGWKSLVKSEAKNQNSKLLSDMMRKSSKLEAIQDEEYGEKEYLKEMTCMMPELTFH